MNARASRITWIAAALLVVSGGSALAQSAAPGTFGGGDGRTAYSPQVPVSAFARPAAWLDPSRMHISTSVSVGTGWGGRTEGLQVTSLSYQVAAPLAMRVSVGNAFGSGGAGRGNGFFLEGLSVAYQPHPSLRINVDYRDMRSPLQYSSYPYSPYPSFGPIAR